MNYLRSGIKSIVGQNPAGHHQTGTEGSETVARLVERLQTASQLEDRRDALRALKSLSKRFRLEVGSQALDVLLDILRDDRINAEILAYAVETLNNVIGGDVDDDENEYSEAEAQDLGERFAQIFIKRPDNVNLVLFLIENYEFSVRLHAVRLLTGLLRHRPKDLQERLLQTPGAISKITDLLQENREIIRNDAVLLLADMVRGNSNIQKIVAFECAFERLLDIVYQEHDSIVAEDCLYVTLQLLKNNSSTQQLFRENSLIQRLPALLRLLSGEISEVTGDDQYDQIQPQGEVQWTAQRISNIHLLFQVIRSLVSSSSTVSNLTSGAQRAMSHCGLLGELCHLMLSGGVPADVLTEAINAVADVIRGYANNQDYFGSVMAPTDPPRSAILVLVMSMMNERQPFAMRLSALYCVESYLYKNEKGKREVVQTLLPSSADVSDVTIGHLLCSGLVGSDPLMVWFSCCILLHCVLDASRAEKDRLLRVQMATGPGSPPVSLLQQAGAVLTQARDLQVRLGVLMLLTGWLTDSPAAVAQFLNHSTHISYLTTQAGSTEGDELEALAHGLSALVLGLCLLYNDDSVETFNRRTLQDIVENRIGRDVFIDRLAFVSKSEAYARAAQKPQPKAKQYTELMFDHEFTKLFRLLEGDMSRIFSRSSAGASSHKHGWTNGDRSKEPASDHTEYGDHSSGTMLNGDLLSALPPQTAEQHQTIVQQYKDLIKRQDHEMMTLKQRVKDLESQAIAASSVKRDDHADEMVNSLKNQLTEKCRIIEEKDSKLKHLEVANVQPDSGQYSRLTELLDKQNAEITRLATELAGCRSENEQLKVIVAQKDTELATVRQYGDAWRTYYESQVPPDQQQVVGNLEAQLKEVESQLSYGWQAYESQSHQLSAAISEQAQLKQQLDNYQQWYQYYRTEFETKSSAQVASAVNQTHSSTENATASALNAERLKEELVVLNEELTTLRKEQEDLLILCADQDRKLKEYRRLLKDNSVADIYDSDDDDSDVEDEGDIEERSCDDEEKSFVRPNHRHGATVMVEGETSFSHGYNRTRGDGVEVNDLR